MLVLAQLGKMLTDWAGPSSVRRWNGRFTNIAPVLATPTSFAEVQEQPNVDGEPCLRLALWVVAEGVGEVVRGEALIAIQPECERETTRRDRQSVGLGRMVAGRVDLGGRRIVTKQIKYK